MRDLDQLTGALRQYLPGGDAITAICALTTGFSNETYLIEGADLILRLPPAAGAMLEGHDVVGQGRIYQELAGSPSAPPVPPVVTICTDTAIIGVPFFVMERIAGEAIDDMTMTPWFVEGNDGLRQQICRDWVAAFAALSNMAPLETLGPVVSPEADASMWREFARSADCPRLVSLFDRLLAVPAPISGPPAVIHGDPKLSNLMWQDQRITAVLDWEMALNGEPLANLGYMLFFFESEFHSAARAQKLSGMMTRDEVIALWEQVSGRSAQGIFWHEIAQTGKTAAIIAEGVNMHNTGRSNDPRLEIFKQNIGYYLGVMEAMLDSVGI
jgi:aminoglycoside phosphotransferase (APT) family kinase protein